MYTVLATKCKHYFQLHFSYVCTLPKNTLTPESYTIFLPEMYMALKRTGFGGSDILFSSLLRDHFYTYSILCLEIPLSALRQFIPSADENR